MKVFRIHSVGAGVIKKTKIYFLAFLVWEFSCWLLLCRTEAWHMLSKKLALWCSFQPIGWCQSNYKMHNQNITKNMFENATLFQN